VKLYELDAAEVIRGRKLCLLPLAPLMRGGVELAAEADALIVASELAEEAKADMLTAMTLLAGLVSEDLALRLLNRRRDLMMQSIGYELIKREGLEEGYKQGFQEGREAGREEGYREGVLEAIALGLELKFGVEGLKLMPEIEAITDLGVLRILEKAIRTAQSPDELRALYRAS